jgi:hypothetical protein
MILAGKDPKYDWPIDVSADFILENGHFSAGRSYVKAILCLYASKSPKSFDDGSKVNIDNAWLKQANSRNYHHFFPKAYLEKKGYDELEINNVVNITIVDEFLNKARIKDKAPSKYMEKFEKENANLAETMKSHLIDDLDNFGIWEDNYEIFLNKRASAISRELRKKIIERDVDKVPQSELEDDETDYYEEDELSY